MNSTPEQRKLAAIMFTDMVGFSALSQRDEALSLDLLAEHRIILREIVPRHGGREVKAMGDGFLFEFPSALAAVKCALEIQRCLHDRNQSLPRPRHVRLRIGIHVGDVVASGGDIHGDGVNLAARIEPLASPGGICVSQAVFEQVRNKVDAGFASLGETGLKNIELPMQVHRVVMPWESGKPAKVARGNPLSMRWAVAGVLLLAGVAIAIWQPWRKSSSHPAISTPSAAPSVRATAPADTKSVAVLAFANLSDDKANEYFSDGISEELLNVLSKVPGLKVSARTSAFSFKGRPIAIAQIAKELGVAYVVEGSVRKSGHRVRITAQLINAADGFHVWSDNFDREDKDIFALQDEIAGLIARNLQLKLGTASGTAASVNAEAIQLYLQGRQEWNLRTKEGFDRAEEFLQRSIALEPNMARAHAALADVWLLRATQFGLDAGTFGWQRSVDARRVLAKAEHAVALDPDSAEAHASLGLALRFVGRFDDGVGELQRAVALNPNYASARQWLGAGLIISGRMDEGLGELQRAAELDPLSHRILDNYANALDLAGRTGEALVVGDRAVALMPDSPQAQGDRALYLVRLGRTEEGVNLARRLTEDRSRDIMTTLVIALGLAGQVADVEAVLGNAARPVAADTRFVGLLALGRTEAALQAMNPTSFVSGDMDAVLFDPVFDPVRDDPRFKQILATLGFTEANERAQAWRAKHPRRAPAKQQ